MAQAISNVATPAQLALNSKLNPSIASGLSIGSGGQVQGGAAAPSNATTASLLLGPLAPKATGSASGSTGLASNVLPSTAPTGAQNQNVPAGPGTGGYTYTNGVLTSVGGQATPQAQTSTPPAPVYASTQQPTQTPAPTFGGLVGQTAVGGQNAVSTGSAQESQAYNEAQALQSQLAGSQANEASTLANMQGNPIPLEFQQGRGNIVQGLYQSQQNALASELQGESNLAGQGTAVQGQGLTALGNAAGLTAPQLGSIGGQQYYNPLNPGQTGGGTLPQAAQDAVNLQIQKVQSGNSTVADAESALSAYGQAGLNALQSGLGSNFSNVQSNANAASQQTNLQNTSSQAQATQQAVTYANQVLNDLTSAYNAQGSLQKTSIPALNSVANLVSTLTGFGISGTQGYNSATGEAVAAVSQALASGGITPTSAGQIAASLIPPNATPAQIQTAQQYLQTFLSQRQSTYTAPPPAATYGGSSNTGNGALPVPVEQMNF